MGRKAQVVPVTERVTVEAYPQYNAIPRTQWKKKFPVRVQVTPPKASSNTPVDFVAVLDISPGMTKKMLDDVKQAMLDVVKVLGPKDRASVVSFCSEMKHCTPLSQMSPEGIKAAFSKADTMAGAGKGDIPGALQEAAKIIKESKCDEDIDRNSFIVLFSAGKDDSIDPKSIRDEEIPVYTFGLGKYFDPTVMYHISENTGATYSFVEYMGSSLKQFIQKEQSVVAMKIEIPFHTHDGVKISSIESGSRKKYVFNEKLSGVVEINRLYAEDTITFMVNLEVPVGGKERMYKKLITGGTADMKLMTVEGIHIMKRADVSVKRTADGTSGEKNFVVDVELERLKFVRLISDLAKKPTAEGLEAIRNELHKSGAHDLVSKWKLDQDISEMQKGISDANNYKMHGLRYMLSWLSSHNWQRATAKGSPYIPDSFLPTSTLQQHKTPHMHNSFLQASTLGQHTMCHATLQLLPCAISALVILLLSVLFGVYTGMLKPLWPALQLMVQSSTVVTVMSRAIQQYLNSVAAYSIILGAFATFVSVEVVSVEQKPHKLKEDKDEDMMIFKRALIMERANIAAYPKACGGRAGRSTVQISDMEGLAVAI